jgi:hypothetical protein
LGEKYLVLQELRRSIPGEHSMVEPPNDRS